MSEEAPPERRGASAKLLRLPTVLDPWQRAEVHRVSMTDDASTLVLLFLTARFFFIYKQIAQSLDMTHESKGLGDSRCIEVATLGSMSPMP